MLSAMHTAWHESQDEDRSPTLPTRGRRLPRTDLTACGGGASPSPPGDRQAAVLGAETKRHGVDRDSQATTNASLPSFYAISRGEEWQ